MLSVMQTGQVSLPREHLALVPIIRQLKVRRRCTRVDPLSLARLVLDPARPRHLRIAERSTGSHEERVVEVPASERDEHVEVDGPRFLAGEDGEVRGAVLRERAVEERGEVRLGVLDGGRGQVRVGGRGAGHGACHAWGRRRLGAWWRRGPRCRPRGGAARCRWRGARRLFRARWTESRAEGGHLVFGEGWRGARFGCTLFLLWIWTWRNTES